jgi:hypothetical protein
LACRSVAGSSSASLLPHLVPHAVRHRTRTPPQGAAGAGYSRRLASLRTTKLRTYASLRRDATPLSGPARDSRNARKRPSGDGVTTCGPGHGDRARHPRPGGEGRICRLTRVRPGPAAVLVMALGVLALLAAWLIAIFRTARQPASGPAHPVREPPAAGSRPIRAARARHLRRARTRRPGRPDQAAAQAGKAERRRSPGCFRGRQRPWLRALWRHRRRSPYTRTRRTTLQPARSAAGAMTSGQSLAPWA